MSEVDSSLIRRGFWTNHELGTVLGATITIDQQLANVVIALLAIVVSVAATSAWDLLLFVVYQLRATSSPRDGLYRQQQLLLRTLLSPGSTCVELLKMFRVWTAQHRPMNVALRCLIPAAVALIFALGSVAAGIFSSYIVDTGSLEVLVSSPSCKDLNLTTWFSGAEDFTLNTLSAATTFADECYSPGPLPSRCQFYVHPRIEWSKILDYCPFQSSICMDPNNALTHDSGYLDSNEILGLNAPVNDRVRFRRKTTCAPLKVAEYISTWNGSDSDFRKLYMRERLPEEKILSLNYGYAGVNSPARLSSNTTLLRSMIAMNISTDFTIQYVHRVFVTTLRSVRASNLEGRKKRAYMSLDMMEHSDFQPIEELQRRDADVFLIFVSANGMHSEQPIDDPVYSAHKPAVQPGKTVYHTDLPMGVVGCAAQYQFCDQNTCTSLNGFTPHNLEELLPSMNHRQATTLELIQRTTAMVTQNTGLDVNPPYLDIISHFNSGYAIGVPPNQWMLDLEKLDSFFWAQLQVIIAMHATGFTNIDEELLTEPPSPTLCRSQKVIKSGGFANISVLGLGFTLALSALLVILDFGIIRVFLFTMDIKKSLSRGLTFWFEEGMFQLQRTAYEAYSVGLWAGTDKEIPVTAPGEMLRNLAWYRTSSTAAHDASSTYLAEAEVKQDSAVVSSVADTLPVQERGQAQSTDPVSPIVPVSPPWPAQSDTSNGPLDSDATKTYVPNPSSQASDTLNPRDTT